MRRCALVFAASAAALLVSGSSFARPQVYPNASVCATAWNRSATFSQKASVARQHPASAQVLARTLTGVPQCLVYFTTAKGTLLASASLRAGAARWTTPKACSSPPAGILARVDRRGFIFLR